MGAGADAPAAQGQPRLGAFEGLALRFFIATKHHRLLWRVQIEAYDIPKLRLEEWSA